MRTMEKTVQYKKPINPFKLIDSTNFINTNCEELVKLVFVIRCSYQDSIIINLLTYVANHKEFIVFVLNSNIF